ncbi:Aldehyde dehydrogenase [hydrothermal vent metagenome]|uniref:Aldehyde dehydrogenase n=1 Tax=hydrothermal vent metagenome TaxID=652676 RepID=A0A3B0T3Z2_9ZZZZ
MKTVKPDTSGDLAATLLIGGAWRRADCGETLPVLAPADGTEFARIARGKKADIDNAVRAAGAALAGEWGAMAAVERGRVLSRLAALVLENFDALAELECRDVGKRALEAEADVRAAARYFEFYGGAADKVHGTTIPFTPGFTVLTLREPHGVTGHIVPWNYPLQIGARSIGAALAMGNAAVVKPAEEASLSLIEIGRLALEAGLPAGAMNIVTGLGTEAGAAMSGHDGIHHLSFTGSPEVGTMVQAAAATHVAPVTLELGGKSPQIVFADADLDTAEATVANAIIQNAGQTCSAGSRVLIESSIYDEMLDRLAKRFGAAVAGPGEANLDCGALISASQKARVEGFLERAEADGIRFVARGRVLPQAPAGGHYVAPALLADVPEDHELICEEVFGPVLVATRFKDEADAIRLANGTPYGLVAGVWTGDGGRQLRVARALRVGQVFVNNFGAGGGVELPFGGVKRSGHGREKGFEALYGFSQLKTIALKHD